MNDYLISLTSMLKTARLIFLLVVIVSCNQETEFSKLIAGSNTFDLLIINGSIVDGTGSEPYAADLLIRADTIAYIGRVDTTRINYKSAINAKEQVVTPGFIDTHAHGDPLFGDKMDNFIAMGVTTIVLGQDGSHPTRTINGQEFGLVNWMDSLMKKLPQINVAMFAGHASIRRKARVAYEDAPTDDQLKEMGDLLKELLENGCYGISTGLEYIGGMHAKEGELTYLAKIVGENGGIMMSHMRNEDNDQVEQSIDELLKFGQYCSVHASHLKVVYGKGSARANEILNQLESAKNRGINISADIYPYLASYTTIGILFPEWAKTQEQFDLAKVTRREELETYLFNRVNQRNGPEATLMAGNQYAGKTLAQAAEENSISFVDLLMQIGPRGGSGAYFIMEDSLMSTLIGHPITMICSDGSPTMRHPRGHGTFARMIERFVMERDQLSLEEAVRKMTGLPATTVGLEKRGTLKTGNYADILVFSPGEVRENATYLDPFQLASGFNHVIINGIEVIKDGSILDHRPGLLLRRK